MTFLSFKRVLFAIMLATFVFVSATAQPVWREIQSTDSTANYDTIYRHDTAYYHAMGLDTAGDDDEYAEFQRWATFWEGRVGPYGTNNSSFYPAYQQMQKLIQSGSSALCNGDSTYNKSWYYAGNKAISTDAPWCGRVARIYVDLKHDTSGNTVYASTGYAGLWRTKNARADTPTWVCLTDTLKLPTMGVYDIAIDPDSANVIYAAVAYQFTNIDAPNGYGLGLIKLRVTDGVNGPSVTWSTTGLTNDPYDNVYASKPTLTVAVKPDNGNIVVAYKDYGIWYSNNRGSTFSQVATVSHSSAYNTNRSIHTIRFHPSYPNIVFAEGGDIATDEGGAPLLRSTDGGQTWQEMKLTYDPSHPNDPNLGLVNDSIEGIYIGMSSYFPNRIVASCARRKPVVNSSTHKVMRIDQYIIMCWSNDTGRTWTQRYEDEGSGGYPIQGTNCVVLSPNDSNTVYVAGYVMRKSTDKGHTYSPLNDGGTSNAHVDTRDLAVKKGPNGKDIVYSGNDGGPSISESSGTNWLKKGGKGLYILQPYGFDINENSSVIVMGCHDNGFQVKRSQWKFLISVDGSRISIDRTDDYVFATDNIGGEVSDNGGASFNYDLGLNNNALNLPITLARHRVYYGNYDTLTQRPTSKIGAFSNIHTFSSHISAIAIAPSDSNVMYVALKSGVADGEHGNAVNFTDRIFRCSNIYATTPAWTDITAGLGAYDWRAATGITVSETDPNKLWVCFGGYTSDIQQVYYSADGGSHWTKMTKGLNPDYHNFPANVIVHQEGTDDAVYLGTDIGVFFNAHASDTSSSWVCFNKSLPVAVVTDLKIDYCNKTIKASLFGRGLWEAPLAVVSDKPRHVTSSQSWHQTEIMHDDLIIDNGVTLTLYGTLRMTKGKKIIVKPGGRLIVETTGKITDNCGDSWDGIYVEGHSNQAQTFANQGSLILKSGSIIENANFAVNVYGLYADYSDIDYSTTGGIVNATGAIFRNNRKDVAFVSYHYKAAGSGYQSRNKSTFENCHFYTDNNCHFSTTDMQQHVTMFEVSGVTFNTCHFEDLRTGINRRTQGRDGIASIRAGYVIDGSCNSYYYPTSHCADYSSRTRFDSLRYAIKAVGLDNANYTVNILGTDFTNNRYGAYLKGINNARVQDDNFRIGGSTAADTLDTLYRYPYGLYLDYSTGYSVQGNLFRCIAKGVAGGTAVSSGTAAGLVIRNSGGDINNFTENTFDSLDVASEAIGNNKNNDPFKPKWGLQFRCNEYTGSMVDLYIDPSFAGSSLPGMAQFQGYSDKGPSKPAGNLFANNSPVLDTNVYNHGNYIKYAHNDTPGYPRVRPIKVTSNFDRYNTGIPGSQRDAMCNSENFTDTSKGSLSSIITSNKNVAETDRSEWETEIDKGNTAGLVSDIQGVDAGTVMDLYNTLMRYSPWLSEEVLIALAQQESYFSADMIRDVMVANPHSSRSDVVRQALESRATHELDATQWDEINAVIDSFTPRDSLAEDWAYHESMFELSFNEELRRELEDTVDRIGSLDSLLQSSGLPQYYYTLAKLYFDRDDYTAATNILSRIQLNFELSGAEKQYYDDFSNYLSLLNQMKEGTPSFSNLDIGTLSSLDYYAGLNNDIAADAQSILVLNNAATYDEPVLLPSGGDGSSAPVLTLSNAQNQPLKKTAQPVSLEVYPNPAHNKVIVRYAVSNKAKQQAMLEFSDVTGKTLKTLLLLGNEGSMELDMSAYQAGLYFFKLKQGSSVLAVKKLSLIK